MSEDTRGPNIGEMKIKLTVDADALHVSFDAIESRVETLLAKLNEVKAVASEMGIVATVEAFSTTVNSIPVKDAHGMITRSV